MNACSYILASIYSHCSKKLLAHCCLNLQPLVSFVFSATSVYNYVKNMTMDGRIFSHSSQFLTIRVAEFSAAEDLFMYFSYFFISGCIMLAKISALNTHIQKHYV